MRRVRTQKKNDDHGSERWLLTYADLITLLLGLFVILYGMSQVDSNKYSRVVQALGGMFGSGVMTEAGSSVLPNQREDIEARVRGAMYEDLQNQTVSVSQDARGVVVHLAEELLFPSGSATLKGASLSRLDLLGAVLKTLPNELRIEGHTDDVPINTAAFPSNWHLSVARAMTVGDYLMGRINLDPQRVTIVGYSQYKPLEPNTTPKNRAKNRRVDIVIVAAKSEPSTAGKDVRQ